MQMILEKKQFLKALFKAGFPRRLENLENENGHGKVTEHEQLAKIHGSLCVSWNFTNFAPELYQFFFFFFFLSQLKKISSDLESLHFPTFSGKLRNGHGKVTEKYFVKSVGTL